QAGVVDQQADGFACQPRCELPDAFTGSDIHAVNNLCSDFRQLIGGLPAHANHFLPLTGIKACKDRKSTRLNSSHVKISYAVFCLVTPRVLHPFPPRRSSDLRPALLISRPMVLPVSPAVSFPMPSLVVTSTPSIICAATSASSSEDCRHTPITSCPSRA